MHELIINNLMVIGIIAVLMLGWTVLNAIILVIQEIADEVRYYRWQKQAYFMKVRKKNGRTSHN